MMGRDELWSRIEWQADRGGRVVWLSGDDGVEMSSLIAQAISGWQQSGHCVLFADLSSMSDPAETERTVLLRLLGPHVGRARSTVSLWRRLEQVLSTSGPEIRVILDRIELARAPGRAVVSTIRHLVTRCRATLIVVSPRNETARSRVLSAWADMEIGATESCGRLERVA